LTASVVRITRILTYVGFDRRHRQDHKDPDLRWL